MNNSRSHLAQVIDAFNILTPQEPLDAQTLSALIDLTPKQVDVYRYSIERAYKAQLTREKQRDYKEDKGPIARKIARSAIRGIERELLRQTRLTASADTPSQLFLFVPGKKVRFNPYDEKRTK